MERIGSPLCLLCLLCLGATYSGFDAAIPRPPQAQSTALLTSSEGLLASSKLLVLPAPEHAWPILANTSPPLPMRLFSASHYIFSHHQDSSLFYHCNTVVIYHRLQRTKTPESETYTLGKNFPCYPKSRLPFAFLIHSKALDRVGLVNGPRSPSFGVRRERPYGTRWTIPPTVFRRLSVSFSRE